MDYKKLNAIFRKAKSSEVEIKLKNAVYAVFTLKHELKYLFAGSEQLARFEIICLDNVRRDIAEFAIYANRP